MVEDQPSETQPSLPPRTRKAKDLQTRLGVGRPKLAGGSGARAVTKSTSTSIQRGKRGKSSRMLSRVEPTIEEEVEPPGPSLRQSEQPAEASGSTELVVQAQPSVFIPTNVSEQIANAIRPLQVRIEGLEEELRNTRQRNQDFERIQAQLNNVEQLQKRYELLEAEVRGLRLEAGSVATLVEEVKQLKESMSVGGSPMLPSTPKPKSPRIPLAGGIGMGLPSAFKAMGFPPLTATSSPTENSKGEGPSSLPNPGKSSTMLGKRPRDSSASVMSGVAEEGEQDQLSEDERARIVFRPNKKRAKLSEAGDKGPVPGSSKLSSMDTAAQLLAPRMPSFIFQGPESPLDDDYLDDPPPTNPLPEVYRPPSPPGAPLLPAALTGRATSPSANEENKNNPFDFSFFPNGNDSYMQPIPFPEPPQSPSPAGNNVGYLSQLQDDRTDAFKEFGFPSPKRPRLSSSGDHSRRHSLGTQRDVSSNDVAASLGLAMVRTGSPSIPEGPPSKMTMYGTELDGETRFGDFGVEGVASGFWSTR
ncbi:hypothetical protein EST38_g1073 [Candolleomyces aberdarensis]|uniref:Uncharacterized protein n=1 Tax=Candolleomyces aberdarensis TaxID=2316362 RepID=A0A4Q2DY06_9AGAR|nr:hypothetical protein EST38_g1073 [Candolleomyces aberdarensis]